jgi:hypothetical protein
MKKILFTLGAAAGLMVATMAAAPSASALTLVNCVGTSSMTLTPGVTNTVQTHDVVGMEVATCVSLTHPSLLSFVSPFDGTMESSCTALFSPGTGTQVFHWNGSQTQTSTWAWTASQSTVNGTEIMTVTGPITDGLLEGSTLTQTVTAPVLDLTACSTPAGIGNLTGPSTWTFTGV